MNSDGLVSRCVSGGQAYSTFSAHSIYEWLHTLDGGVNDEMMDRAWPWSSCFLPTTCAVEGAVAEVRRRPERAQAPRAGRPYVLFEAGLAMGGVPPRRCWSGLSAISLGYRRRDELSASGAARACAMGGAPVWECGRVDVNTQHDVSIGLEPLLHFLGHLQPFFPARWHLVAIVEKCSNAG